MPRHDHIPEPWSSFLKELDALATETVRMDCIGGFVVTMLYGLNRATADAFSKVAMLGGPLFQKYGVYLDLVTVAQPPYEYESGCRRCSLEHFAIFVSWPLIHTTSH